MGHITVAAQPFTKCITETTWKEKESQSFKWSVLNVDMEKLDYCSKTPQICTTMETQSDWQSAVSQTSIDE
jgi:hypothetical protein